MTLAEYLKYRFVQAISMIIANQTGAEPDAYINDIRLTREHGLQITPELRTICIENLICHEPHFDEPSILGAMRKTYEK